MRARHRNVCTTASPRFCRGAEALAWLVRRCRGLLGRLFVYTALLAGAPLASADNVDGAFSAVEDWPLIAVHAALTPDGRVLTYGTTGSGTQTGYFIYDVWDPESGLGGGHMTLQNMTLTDLFCSSQIILPQSGDILISGGDNWTGTNTTNTGNNNSNLFDYGDNTLARSVNMHRARWYASSTALVNGEIYIQGGSGGTDRPEVRQIDGTFRLLSGVPTGMYHYFFPRNFLAPDGRVFGYDGSGKMYFVTTGGSGSKADAGQFSSANAGVTSSAAMFRPGKILQIGGNSNGAIVIDVNGPEPTVTPTQSMSTQRQWVSATILADGRVLATGGSVVENTLSGVNNHAEIWDPATGQWHLGDEAGPARLYHSSALLLPDATVLVAGGGAPGPQVNTNAEIYSPPYLFDGAGNLAARPQIVTAPDTVEVGDSLAVQVDAAISRVTLVKTGSTTHSVNMDQRFLELPFSASGNMLEVYLPVRASDTPPGFYLLFVIDAAGVPSMGRIVRINIDPTPNTAVDYTPTIGGGGGSPYLLACNEDEILVGVHGKYATYVNQIGARCVKMDQLGRWIGDPVNRGLTGGTSSGTAFTRTCPRDFAVSGFEGRSGQYVNQVDIACKALTPAGSLTGAGQNLGPAGGSGGSAQGPHRCGTNHPVYALYGRSSGYLDSFGVQCRPGVITPVSTNSEPVIVNPGAQSDYVGLAVTLAISASDGDGDVLTFAAGGLPPGLGIDTVTGVISGTPTTAGSFAADVSVTDGTDVDVAYFNWDIAAAAPLSVDPMPPQAPTLANAVVAYTASANGGVNVVYRWNFGDGSGDTAYSASPSVQHSYSSPGIYYVTLTVNDDYGVAQIQTFVQTIHLLLSAGPSANSSPIAYENRTAGASRVWVVNPDNDSVSVLDADTHSLLAEISVGAGPRSVAVAPDGRVWVTNKTSATLSIIDADALSVAQTVALPYASQPHGIVFSAASNEAWVVLEAGGSVLALDASSTAEIDSVTVGPHARHLAVRHVTGSFEQDGNGLLVIEAENFGASGGGAAGPWQVIADPAAANSAAIQAADGIKTEDQATAPYTEYVANFGHTGDHHIWLRVNMTDVSSNSLFVAIDGAPWQVRQLAEGEGYGSWVWMKMNDTALIASAGEHTIRVYRREKNARVDKLLLTTDPGYVPSGIGAAESSRELPARTVYVSRFVTPAQPGEDTAAPQSESGGVPAGAEVLVVDAESMAVTGTVVLQHGNKPDGENQGSGVPNYLGAAAISPDGTAAWVPSKQDNIKRGSSRSGKNLNFQNTVRAVSSRIDLGANAEDQPARIDHDNASVASAAVFGPLGVYLFVALETSREVAVVDVHGGDEIFRIPSGRAPQGLALSPDGTRLWVSNFMDRSVTVFDLAQLRSEGLWVAPQLASVATVASDALPAQVLAGKQLFYDAFDTRLARDRYLSCASCHNDGAGDGRVWDLAGMGEGLRNTIDLRGVAAGRLHWSQNFDEVQDFEGQIRTLAGGDGLMPDADFFAGTRSEPFGEPKAGISPDLDALAAYVLSLDRYPDSPFRNGDGTATASAVAGSEVFLAQHCAACHSGVAFTDGDLGVLHDIGTLRPASGSRLGAILPGIDTPTLRGAWMSAPYLHDGSAASLADAVAAHDALAIESGDMPNLVAYLEQIGEPTASDFDGDGIADADDSDDDNDALSDAFETGHAMNPLDPDDARLDPDGDGLSSLEEFLLDPALDPNDPDSDGDGIGDRFDADLANANNACSGGDALNATLAQLVAADLTCAAGVSISVDPPSAVVAPGHLRLIAPRVVIHAGFHATRVTVIAAEPCPGCSP